jgi:hypothetical protein
MDIVLRRKGAICEPGPNNNLLVTCVACVEFLSPGRVSNLAVRGDLPLKPGIIYRGYTGVTAIFGEVLPRPHQITVRPTLETWRVSGVEIKRVDFGEDGELILYFTVLEQVVVGQAPFKFELYSDIYMNQTSVEDMDHLLTIPGIKIAVEPANARRVVGYRGPVSLTQPMNDAAADKLAEQKAAAWLNTPDERGKIISGPVLPEPPRPPPERPAKVTAAVAPKDMGSNLKRGVVAAPLKSSQTLTQDGMPVATEGTPPPKTLKEEYVTLTPQPERLADPVTNLDGI